MYALLEQKCDSHWCHIVKKLEIIKIPLALYTTCTGGNGLGHGFGIRQTTHWPWKRYIGPLQTSCLGNVLTYFLAYLLTDRLTYLRTDLLTCLLTCFLAYLLKDRLTA